MSEYYKGYKFKIYPTEEQKCLIDKYINLSRYVYNWGIAKQEELYKLYKEGLSEKRIYSVLDLYTILKQERNNNPELYWLKEIPDHTARTALKNVVNTYKNYFRNKNYKHPRFKSKKHSKQSFNTRNDTFTVKDDRIKFEGMKYREFISLNFNSGLNIKKAYSPSISKDKLGNYYVSFSIKVEEDHNILSNKKSNGIGIDVGERKTYILSTGEIYNQPKDKLERLEYKLQKQQRRVNRDINRRLELSKRTKTKYEDIPKSKRAIKRELRLNKIYKKIHDTKDTFYHTITKQIVMKNPEFVCMETLNVKKMRKNKVFSKMSNTSFFDMIQKMKSKCERYNIPFIQAPRYFPSSKTCSNCGYIKNMKNKHTYNCPNCGMVEDRDINAAINLRNYGLEYMNNI